MGNNTFAALNFHCHARTSIIRILVLLSFDALTRARVRSSATCLSMEVYACEIGTPLEQCNATVGRLLCREEPVYGGSGHPGVAGTKFDEAGYIAQADCMWGSKAYGLESPVNLTGVPLHMVKTSNSSIGHYGEMAGGM